MAQAQKTTNGEIFEVQDHGSIVVVLFLAYDDQRVVLIPFDHRPFGWLLQGEGWEPSDLIVAAVLTAEPLPWLLDPEEHATLHEVRGLMWVAP